MNNNRNLKTLINGEIFLSETEQSIKRPKNTLLIKEKGYCSAV